MTIAQKQDQLQNTIERDVFINASLDKVWGLVSKTGFWAGEKLHFEHEGKVGETVTVSAGKYGEFPVRVERLEPQRFAAYRWASGFPGSQITSENSTLIEFELSNESGGVRVSVRETGFSGISGTDDFRLGQYQSNLGGWSSQLELLKIAAES